VSAFGDRRVRVVRQGGGPNDPSPEILFGAIRSGVIRYVESKGEGW
jgi:hypothetical protein